MIDDQTDLAAATCLADVVDILQNAATLYRTVPGKAGCWHKVASILDKTADRVAAVKAKPKRGKR